MPGAFRDTAMPENTPTESDFTPKEPVCIPSSLPQRSPTWSQKPFGILAWIFQKNNSIDYYFNY